MLTKRRSSRPAPIPPTNAALGWRPRFSYVSTAPITLASVTMGESTDELVGLPDDPVAQRRAEEFVAASLAFRAKREAITAKAAAILPTAQAVHVELDNESMVLVDPTNTLSPVEVGILEELRRLCGMPGSDLGSTSRPVVLS